MLLLSPNPAALVRYLYAKVRCLTNPRPVTVDVELQSQIQIATHLENATQPERPWYGLAAKEEVAHLHHITDQPIGDHGQSEAPARACLMVLEDLRKRKGGFDGKTEVAEERDVCCGRGDGSEEDMYDEET